MKTIKFQILITLSVVIIFSGCRKSVFVPFGENIQEGVMVYFEVTEKTPQEVSDQYYGILGENLGNYSGFELPQRIERPWAFGFLGFNPLNGEMKFIFVADERFPEMIECGRDAVENIVIFRDDLNRETGGFTVIGTKAYVYSGSSTYSVLKAVAENERPFYLSEDFLKFSEIYSGEDWIRVFVPGTVFALLDMVPPEFKPVFLEDIKAENVKGMAARVSGGKTLSLEAVAVVDTGEVRAEISFSGWEPQKAHGSISRMFFWNLL